MMPMQLTCKFCLKQRVRQRLDNRCEDGFQAGVAGGTDAASAASRDLAALGVCVSAPSAVQYVQLAAESTADPAPTAATSTQVCKQEAYACDVMPWCGMGI